MRRQATIRDNLALAGIAGMAAAVESASQPPWVRRSDRWDRSFRSTLWLAGGCDQCTVLVRRVASSHYISFVLLPLWALYGWALASLDSLTAARPG